MNELLPASRKEAKIKKTAQYFTGRKCPHGHIAKRYTIGGNCCECTRLFSTSAKKKEYDKQYYKKNTERISRKLRTYYLANRQKVLSNVKRWREENPEKRATISNSYKARRRAQAGGSDATAEIHEWANNQDKVCYWCAADCEKSYHMDHYYPLSRGGKHTVENLVIACPTCNHRKHAKDPKEFAREVARHIVNPNMLA